MGASGNWSWCFIYFAAFATSLTAFATGACFVWTCPFLPKFQLEDPEVNAIGRPITTSESAWIVSALSLGLIFGPPFSIFCLKFLTKKSLLLIAMTPLLLANALCCFASQVNMFIFARWLMGIGTGAIWTVLGTYIAEISEDKNRGLLGSVPGIMSNLGSLLVYAIGPYLSMTTFSIILLIPLVLCFICFGYFVPDSPYDLLVKNKPNHAEKSLKKLRMTKNVQKEVTFIRETIDSGTTQNVSLSDLLKNGRLRRGLLICITLMMCQQLSGILAVISYAEIIFKLAGGSISSAISAIILGIVSTSSNILSLLYVDKMGRKVLLSSSCICEAISLFALGLYFNLSNSGIDTSALTWLPVVSLMVFMAAFNFGLGIVPWIVTGEVFHSSVKALASTLIALSNFTCSFIVTMCFPYMLEYFGLGWTFWVFAIFMILGSLFCVLVLPETKGKSFLEIQNILKK